MEKRRKTGAVPHVGAQTSPIPREASWLYSFFNDARYSTRSTNSCLVMPSCRPAGMMDNFGDGGLLSAFGFLRRLKASNRLAQSQTTRSEFSESVS